MKNWYTLLEELIPSPCFERPFVCDGFPSDSTVIVVGENPATPMHVDWWSFWSTDLRFNYKRFMTTYLVERKKLGKGISNTRRRLARFRQNGIFCVETNVHRNEQLNGAGTGAPNYDILNLLISNMPKLVTIVAHGKAAHEYLNQASIPDQIRQYRTRHFRIESFSKIDEICKESFCST